MTDVQHYINQLKRSIAALECEIQRIDKPEPLIPRCPLCEGVLVQRRNRSGKGMSWVQCERCGKHFMLVQEEGHKVRE